MTRIEKCVVVSPTSRHRDVPTSHLQVTQYRRTANRAMVPFRSGGGTSNYLNLVTFH
jgi:hypothetical protein